MAIPFAFSLYIYICSCICICDIESVQCPTYWVPLIRAALTSMPLGMSLFSHSFSLMSGSLPSLDSKSMSPVKGAI